MYVFKLSRDISALYVPNLNHFEANIKLYFISQVVFLKLPTLPPPRLTHFTQPRNSHLAPNRPHAMIATFKVFLQGKLWGYVVLASFLIISIVT